MFDMVKSTNKKKSPKKTMSLRFHEDEMELIKTIAKQRGLSVSDSIMQDVRTAQTNSNLISPDELSRVDNITSQILELAEQLKTSTDALNNRSEIHLDSKMQSYIDEKEEQEFKERLSKWFESSIASIKSSKNPVSLSKRLIKMGMDEYGLSDYAVSILEPTADYKEPIRE